MRRSILALIVICSTANVFGQGTVEDLEFYSNALQSNRSVQVYRPEGYNPSDSTRYPVIYYLHGALGGSRSYPKLPGILDSLVSAQIISPVIVVKPGGDVDQGGNVTFKPAGSWYANSELYGRFEDFITIDVVNFIDNRFKTFADRDQRSITGHSMGGAGAMILALKHPDIYRGVASLSGPLSYASFPDRADAIKAENEGPPYNYDPGNGFWTNIYFGLAGAYSPNLQNPPYNVDFLLDSNGEVVDSVLAKWMLYDPAFLAANFTPGYDLAVYFDCGRQDQLVDYQTNVAFADSLDKLGWEYDFLSYDGGHGNEKDTRVAIAFAYLDSVMSSTPVSVNDQQSSPIDFTTLYQNYPNPFNPETEIHFRLPKSSQVVLTIFNTLGQEVRTLTDSHYGAGDYTIHWDGKQNNGIPVPSGIYFYQLQAGAFLQMRKMTLLR